MWPSGTLKMKEGLKVAEDRGRTLVSGVRKSANLSSKNNDKLNKVVKNNHFRSEERAHMPTAN